MVKSLLDVETTPCIAFKYPNLSSTLRGFDIFSDHNLLTCLPTVHSPNEVVVGNECKCANNETSCERT